MKLIGAGRTDVGRRRDFNEDSLAIDLGAGLLALADGMGGHAAGEVASKIATETVLEFVRATAGKRHIDWPYGYDEGQSLSANKLRSAVHLANDRIFKTIEDHPEMKGMGTTLVTVLAQGAAACVANIGDSRVYSYRSGHLTQLTSDHSWVGEQVRMGNLSAEEAVRHPFRNVITRALGSREDVSADLKELRLEPGDRMLLCSDGLTTMIEDKEILEVLEAWPDDPAAAAAALVDRANEAGGEDNITVIVAGWR